MDAFEAATWYESEREGLGASFLRGLRLVFGRIEHGPLQFPLVTAAIRRAILSRFPFGVFFFIQDDVSTVIAEMHLHRHPNSWEQRR